MKTYAPREHVLVTHKYLLNLLTERIQRTGGRPHFHRRIDVSTRIDNHLYLFKIKSIRYGSVHSNLVYQGMNQLYEYCYFQKVSEDEVTLILVAGKSVSAWIRDFLEEGRNIRVLWYENDEFHASPKTRKELAFLW